MKHPLTLPIGQTLADRVHRLLSPTSTTVAGLFQAVGLTADAARWSHQCVLISLEPDVFRLLADPLRARIVDLLADEALCTCHLVDRLEARQTNVSNHLRVLREAGVVRAEHVGRFTYYHLVPEVLEAAAGQISSLAERARAAASAGVRRECR